LDQDWLEQIRIRIDQALDNALGTHLGDSKLLDAARYSVLRGGKRLRPALVYAAADAAGASPDAADAAAIAVELLHAYSLIHDDLPAMDDDALRRGQPTTHIAFDEATAILAGDALQALAFSILGETDSRTDRMRVKQLNLLGGRWPKPVKRASVLRFRLNSLPNQQTPKLWWRMNGELRLAPQL